MSLVQYLNRVVGGGLCGWGEGSCTPLASCFYEGHKRCCCDNTQVLTPPLVVGPKQ